MGKNTMAFTARGMWSLAIALAMCGCGKSYDLKGPAPQTGDAVRSETRVELTNAAMSVSMMGETVRGRMNLTHSQAQRLEIVEVDGHEPSSVRITVERDVTKTTATFEDFTEDETEHSPLEGLTVLGERRGGGWRMRLESGDTTPEIEEALNELAQAMAVFMDEPYPDRPIAVGRTWQVEGEQIAAIVGAGLRNATGSAKFEFARVVSYQDQHAAEILADINVSGTLDMGDQSFTMRMDLNGTIYRSLESHIDLGATFNGTMNMRGAISEGGLRLDLTVNGPVTVTASNARLR